MPLDRLIDRIMRDAREQYDDIVAGARAERDRILVDADTMAKDIFREDVARARAEALEEKKRAVAVSALGARRRVLEKKRALIDAAFGRALDELDELPEEQYLELLLDLMAASGVGSDTEVILSPSDAERLGAELVRRANEQRAADGLPGRLTLSDETRAIRAGFVLRSGGVEVNSSIEALVSQKRDELEAEVVRLLFGGD